MDALVMLPLPALLRVTVPSEAVKLISLFLTEVGVRAIGIVPLVILVAFVASVLGTFSKEIAVLAAVTLLAVTIAAIGNCVASKEPEKAPVLLIFPALVATLAAERPPEPIVPVIVPALSKDFELSGLLPSFNLVFSVALNLEFTLPCEPVIVSKATVPSGVLPALKLVSFVLSSVENTLFITAVPPPIEKLNLPSVLSVGNVTLLLDSCSLAAVSAASDLLVASVAAAV